MYENNLQRRTTFIIKMLSYLKDINNQLMKISTGIEEFSDSIYEKTLRENRNEIQNEIIKYKDNTEKIKQQNREITLRINAWYDFTKDSREIKKALFPLKFIYKKNKLRKNIKALNDMISNLTIENRFICERLTAWEQKLELKAIEHIKQGYEHTTYEQLAKKKEQIIIELKYLLPTLPEVTEIELDINNIDNLIEKLAQIAAA